MQHACVKCKKNEQDNICKKTISLVQYNHHLIEKEHEIIAWILY